MLLLSSLSLQNILFYISLFSIMYGFFPPHGDCDKWSNPEQITKSNNFKLKAVNLTDGTADMILSAQGCYPAVVSLLELSHTKLTVGHRGCFDIVLWVHLAQVGLVRKSLISHI